jgi:hypothetical protein
MAKHKTDDTAPLPSIETLAALGITPDMLLDRLAARLERAFGKTYDDDGVMVALTERYEQRVRVAVDAAVASAGSRLVLPNVTQMIETIVLQKTNEWGEKTGKPVPFIEYLTKRAELYLTEEVDHNGQTKAESRDGYNWRKRSTRIVHLVNAHLQYSIDLAMKDALKNANSAITKGIEGAIRLALAEAQTKLKIEVKV